MKYLKIFTDYADDIEELSDTECGRLFRAMLKYASSGAEPEFRGNERFYWKAAKRNIDSARETYDRMVESMANARGARNQSDINHKSDRNLSEISQKSTQDKEKDKDKVKTKKSPNGDNNPPYPPTALDEAIERFKAHRKGLKKPMSDHAVELLRKKLADMAADEETQIAILDQSIFNGWQGVFHLRDDAQASRSQSGGDKLAHPRAMYDKYAKEEQTIEVQ